MDYEKKYKEALEMAQKLYQDCPNGKNDRIYHTTDLEKMFPELKESEDEKVRKALIRFHKSTIDIDGIKGDEIVTWLGNIPYTIDHEKREGFHLGYKAALEKQGESSIKWSKNTEGNKPQVNHSVLMKTTHGIAEGEWQGEYWHQYRWASIVRDSDVLSWIEFSDLNKQGEQKHDDKVKPKFKVGDTIRPKGSLAEYTIESIYGERYHGKGWGLDISCDNDYELVKQESAWSCEDETRLQACIDTLQANSLMGKVDTVMTNWLKSLKQRCAWKPSDEQMESLEQFISEYKDIDDSNRAYPISHIIESLYNDLKKLKGE